MQHTERDIILTSLGDLKEDCPKNERELSEELLSKDQETFIAR